MVPLIVVVVCFAGGVWATLRWLPPLARGPAGTLAYYGVCVLAGGVLAIVGLEVWEVIHVLSTSEPRGEGVFGRDKAEIVADALAQIFRDAGSLAALTLIAYLVAPKAKPPESS
ncbi:MAG TPA: hypothetical protein VMA83_06770 [Solirubrobacteraceae bacterium]|nr:hypothetical protein [Solirubrobacteraceae bacterium]